MPSYKLIIAGPAPAGYLAAQALQNLQIELKKIDAQTCSPWKLDCNPQGKRPHQMGGKQCINEASCRSLKQKPFLKDLSISIHNLCMNV